MNSSYEINEDFDGVFRFTNATDEDFIFLWNNKEYVFPTKTCCPMIIASESLENIQAIRKKAAFKLATREFYKGKEYKGMVKNGKADPSTFDEKVLQPWIDECLKPLPSARAKVKELKKDDDRNYKASKSISKDANLAYDFKDDQAQEIGEMPQTAL